MTAVRQTCPTASAAAGRGRARRAPRDDRRSRGRSGQRPAGGGRPLLWFPGVAACRCMSRAVRGGRVVPMIKVEGLTRAYGSFTAVDDISFECRPGTVTGFLGPNGAGKTTTMRVMVGLTPPTHGDVTIGGLHYHDIPNPGRHVGVLLDASAQHAGRTGREVLDDRRPDHGPAGLAGRRDARAGLARRRREAKRRVRNYSLGMRQRLGIAHALLGDPIGADPRRARQRPRPGGHPLDARPAQGVRRPGRHRAAVQPPAPRGRADRRRDDPDRPRPDRGPGHQRRAARATRPAAWRRRWSPRSTTTSSPRR